MFTVQPKERDANTGRIRWYKLVSDTRLSYLKDGFSMGAYRFKRDALNRAKELNK